MTTLTVKPLSERPDGIAEIAIDREAKRHNSGTVGDHYAACSCGWTATGMKDKQAGLDATTEHLNSVYAPYRPVPK